MRNTLACLAFIVPCACGGRTLGEWPAQARGEGGSVSGAPSGGSLAFAGSGGVSTGSGGLNSGGATSHSGAPSSGGLGSGGLASGGAAPGGSAGREACFEATQAEGDRCIHVRLCSAAQYEIQCVMATPSTAVCFCYVNGQAQSAKSILSATTDTLCEPAVAAQCP